MKSKRKMFFIGQIVIILVLGVGIDKIINVNTQPSKSNIAPYVNIFTKEISPKKELKYPEITELKNAEDVWSQQESKMLDAEDRYSNNELARMILDGEATRVERIIQIDKYDKDEVDKEVERIKVDIEIEKQKAEKIKKEKEKAEQLEIEQAKKLKLNSLISVTSNDFVETSVNQSISKQVIPAFPHTEFKSYMAWTALSPKYAQGQLCAKGTPDPKTAIMTYEGRYLVALGTAYADHVGQKFDVVMENGTIIPVMVGDFKANEHTDDNNSTTVHDGSIIEFIVSSNDDAALVTKRTGSYNGIFPGKIKEFREIV